MITRQRAVQILEEHGFTPNSPTAWIPSEERYAEDSTFDQQVSFKTEYSLMEVLGWLGYCCPTC